MFGIHIYMSVITHLKKKKKKSDFFYKANSNACQFLGFIKIRNDERMWNLTCSGVIFVPHHWHSMANGVAQ